ncbi:PDZ domain-containing protein 4 [Sinocyclocheilus rhinocerous]|uniref:PDZ domain-containing protein 4 n=1 Tax=Sinocyclocheilus rhinocerous TaxID=307959 RepID=UPI0007B969DD|nr:PREDICTED: PDZ domain-containing protein 4-like [Sinocyclocheilus rhinocerous]
MGCNMCVVQKPEEQCRVMFQVNSRDLTQLSQEQSLHALRCRRNMRWGPRRKAGVPGAAGGTMVMTDCVDSGTQTDISFQHMVTLGRPVHHNRPASTPSPPLPPMPEPYLFSQLPAIDHVYYDPTDYFDISQHEVDRQDDLEYEEVELYKSCQQDKLGLTVCYRTDDEEDLGIYVGEVNPNSIAAKDGRIREGDRILQINGMDVQNREEAVAILTREDSTNISLLLARPDIENEADDLDLELGEGLDLEDLENVSNSPSPQHRRKTSSVLSDINGIRAARPNLWHTALNNSQELDSGVGRTDESTRCEESSELADDATSACTTNATNTPGSLRKFRAAQHGWEFHYSNDSLLGPDAVGAVDHGAPESLPGSMIPGLTEEEYERYRELLEIRCLYEKNRNALFLLDGRNHGGGVGDFAGAGVPVDMNCNESLMQHEIALLDEEIRHLEFKWRNVLRAQKMQQLRQRCLKVWPADEEDDEEKGAKARCGGAEAIHHDLSDINEIPERERSDKESTSAGSAKRPVRDRLLKARAMKIREERSGMTTDDDAVSEMKMGRYWSKEERKQQLLRAREQRRRREFMMQSRLDFLREKEKEQDSGPQGQASILELSQKKSMKKRSRRILDNWITIQELLAHGTRSVDGKKVFNPLLSVTTV